ncbi:methylmalonyl Co-A mutase-associated GTPase MeaB [Litorilinea aerophila]|uniref:Methylmalonyl Co-A mutase-associated GTPase MeaB n=1 Tax=Litorilinea aerophila TaxID=1204385 RepID=A0A540VDR3_9CHLR|nr:methylmalonyl Co-A mutase-associated GTPase MeaB [Litorilinea aerophila]MCC9077421.1 methylmalonyl Co-A mutase-associated GTPase MeaB [Litorilinea aerophila]GIV80045.1 MAG: GTPase [Litorilinea sp.]
MAPVKARPSPDVATLVAGIRQGNRLLLARAISRIEDEAPDAQALLQALFPHTGHAHLIGITGAPGTGKSTLVTALVQAYRARGLTVAVVAVDPTSPFSGGALLGDRVRMRALSGDPGVFIRSMATRGNLGGLSKTTGDVITLLDAAGFDRIVVETVGVGQAEVEIATTAHTTVVVEAPGLGDEVQAIKAGILEIGDILVVNKADLPGTDRTVKALEAMLEMGRGGTRTVRHHGHLLSMELPAASSPSPQAGWTVTVLKTVATTGHGVEALCGRIEAHRDWLQESGELDVRERARIAHSLENIVRATLAQRMARELPAQALQDLVDTVRQRRQDPYSAAQQLLATLTGAAVSSQEA